MTLNVKRETPSHTGTQKTPNDWVTQSPPSRNPGGHDVTLIYPKLRLDHERPNKYMIDSLSA